ncbi:MAG: amidohydrolase family protein [Clostridia bacterium]|nr:amidohydrolase family protein [Clostridia bacterium]
MLNNGVKGFVLLDNPLLSGSLSPESMSKIAETLVNHKKPLILCNTSTEARFDKVSKLAKAFPELDIVMQGTTWNTNRLFFEVMDQNSNLYFDISSNHTNGILEITKKHFGIQRALYSSTWPQKSMGAMKSMVEYADITDADKTLVASGNACRLFGISHNELTLYDDSQCKLDEIALEADAGKPISVPVIDAHSHIGAKGCATNTTIMKFSSPDEIVKKLDRTGIDTTFTAPWSGISYDGIQAGKEILDAYKNYPGRFLGYMCYNPNYPNNLESAKEMILQNPDAFVGIKPYPPSFGFELTDDVMKDWFEFADKHHLLVLIHGGNAHYAEQTDYLSSIYKNATFVLAHCGVNFSIAKKCAEIANKRDNVVLDITITATTRKMVEFLVAEVGADKIVFGSDMPMRDLSPQLGWICYADIPIEDKKKILAENIKRLLDKRI